MSLPSHAVILLSEWNV